MKKFNFKPLVVVALIAFVLSGFTGLQKMKKSASQIQFKVTPELLETHAEEVDVAVDGRFPAKYFNKKATLEITPILKYEGGETKLAPGSVQGEKVEANNRVISYNSGGSFSYNDDTDFSKEMRQSELVVHIKAIYGDFYHAAAPYSQALKKAVQGKSVMLTEEFYPSEFNSAMLEACDLFILCKEGVVPGSSELSVRWMDSEGELAIENFVQEGGTLFLWHSGLASYDAEGPIHAMYGGHFHGHPAQHAFELVSEGVEDSPCPEAVSLTMTDELYTMAVELDDSEIWLKGHSPKNGIQPVGWTKRHGKGKVICYTLAHERPNLMCNLTQSILKNIVASAKK